MAIEKMKFVATNTDFEHLDEMLIAVMKSGVLHPEPAINIITEENGGKLISEENAYSEYLSSLRTIGHNIGLHFDNNDCPSRTYTKDEIEDFILELEEQVNLAVGKDAAYLTLDDNIALKKLNEIYDFEKIHSCKYIHFGFGRLPIDSYKKLTMYADKPYVVNKLHENKQYYWVLYVTSTAFFKEIKGIFESLYLEVIDIPNIDVAKVVEKYKDKMADIHKFCVINDELYQLHKYVLIMKDKNVICGFVPENKIEHYKNSFKDIPVDFRVKDPKIIPKATPPTVLKNNWFFKPFELFVSMYSLPNYYDIDPTKFLAITYCILFGIMFGDLGQGFILFIIGTYFSVKKKNKLMGILSRVGLSSMVFGFLFGSVFGDEHVLIPIHQSVFNVREKLFEVMSSSSTMVLLVAAISIGALLIICSMLINIALHIKHKKYVEALISQNGIVGLIFYMYFIVAFTLKGIFKVDIFKSMYLIPFVLIPILLFFFKEPIERLVHKEDVRPKAGWGNFILETFFEVFEIILSFVTNSLSYLRVGGFVLSHAGMMFVVMTLAKMTGNASLIVIILGNMFVILLEGMIVGIQALRLEYYEMFSRYYNGGGKKYEVLAYEE